MRGKRVHDAGCGTGAYAEWLLDRGAEVVGVDVSEGMLERARDRLGDAAELHRADLGEPLPLADDGAFDGVVSGLALDYVRDWRLAFSEFDRLLVPGGFVVFSVGHPVEQYVDTEAANYFETERLRKDWGVEVPYYRRPLSEIVAPVLEADFRLDGIVEPRPTAAFAEERPEAFEKESNQPVFVYLRAVKP